MFTSTKCQVFLRRNGFLKSKPPFRNLCAPCSEIASFPGFSS
ncbi:hypothetical protein NC652_000072 [Populus alba x Populus x berolinensis]|nr:hypothetical protein NC652_000072 [Populus alba x Populus x berolinensis]